LSRYEQRVFAWCYRYARNREQALDLTQEVLTRAWRSLGSFRHGSRVSWWMFVITRNRCLSAVRATRWLADDDVALEDLPASDLAPDEAYLQQLDEQALLRLIETHLDSEERMAIWLCCFDRMPIDEITRTMRLASASGARGLLQRARRKLRTALARRAQEGT
jgi:RNA polymerase sigma-70 factor (ECF subfamily)